jgi:tRNA threonylcarbamoyladenosine biosynthesis protein TsaE
VLVANLQWLDESATQAFAHTLARQPELANAFITLHGDLGAGKTTLARHLLQALGVSGRIKSPTYAIVESYELPELAIWHCDFYRFNDPQEWEDAGFRDLFASPGLKLVEWPQKAEGLLPVADLDIAIRTDSESARQVTLHSHTARGAALLQALAQATPTSAGPGA